jgi:CRISPR system Cascade subunit CasA
MKRGAGAAILALGLSACAHYAPAPPHTERFTATHDAARLDQKPADAVWSGPDLLAAALARNPQIAEARAKYVVALAAVRLAKSPPGPSLTLTAEYADESPRWGYTGAIDLPLDFGTPRHVRVTTAQLQALQAFYDYGEAVWSVRTDLEKARIDLTSAEAQIILAQRAVALRSERVARLEARVSAGQDARTVALTAQGDLSAARARLSAAQGQREAALAALARGLGVGPAAVRGLRLAAPTEPPPRDGLADWRRDAAQSRRDVLRAVADYDIAENALRLEIAKQYPTLSLGPAYNYDHGVNKFPFSLSLALPPYDLNRRSIAQAEATRAAAGRSLELAQAEALAAVDTASAALHTAADDRERIRTRDLPTAQRSADAAARAARAGEGDRVDDLAAQAAVADAGLDLLDASHTYDAAAADLEDALRRSFDPAETALIQTAMTDARGAR